MLEKRLNDYETFDENIFNALGYYFAHDVSQIVNSAKLAALLLSIVAKL